MNALNLLHTLVKDTATKCLEWVEESDTGTFFADPLEGGEISAHYGATHAAASFLLLGEKIGDKRLKAVGEKLFISILDRWKASAHLQDFHYDFNNFAVCVIITKAGELLANKSIVERAKKIIISSPDSDHDTINWLPMRWFVNLCRYEWTKEKQYSEKCEKCAKKKTESRA